MREGLEHIWEGGTEAEWQRAFLRMTGGEGYAWVDSEEAERVAEISGQVGTELLLWAAGGYVVKVVAAPLWMAGRTARIGAWSSRILHISSRNAQKVFGKHGADFGLSGAWSPARAVEVRRAINSFINRTGIRKISGTYRGQRVIHYLDPRTGQNVIADLNGELIGAWKLGAEQLKHVLTSGRLF